MKTGKKPTVAQRKFVKARSLNSENWLVSQDNRERMFLERMSFYS